MTTAVDDAPPAVVEAGRQLLLENGARVPTQSGDMLEHIIERAAFAPEFDVDRVTQLLALKDRWDAVKQVKAYARDMVEFKKNRPEIFKNKHVSFGNTNYDHATHDEVTDKLSDALARFGFTHAWSMSQTDKAITVRCTLTHLEGHTGFAELTSINDGSGGKNSTQAIASANSYLQRYTLLAVTGTSTKDMPNDDGRGAQGPETTVAEDVWTFLTDARGSLEELGTAWSSLDPETRAKITLYHKQRWEDLKGAPK
jgi:hypothetical protein